MAMKREKVIEIIRDTLNSYGIRKAYLFGSFARRERTYHDVDIAIEPPEGKFSLLDMVHIENSLQDVVGKKCDLVTLRSINPRMRPYIEKDLVEIV
ncbi:MAG: nucleotidyltransferase domain-containing protein [Candidatus ainarchaeum sp.]|nr:nucleotidyltransferase domain-containing protein [Candidatus ainarchaeum sp.]